CWGSACYIPHMDAWVVHELGHDFGVQVHYPDESRRYICGSGDGRTYYYSVMSYCWAGLHDYTWFDNGNWIIVCNQPYGSRVFAYSDADHEPYFVVVDQSGTVTTGTSASAPEGSQGDHHWWPFGHVGGSPVAEPPMDSDRAAGVLLDTSRAWRENAGEKGTEV